MKNETQNQPINKGKGSKSKKYDVFISYRYLSTKDKETNPDHIHITSLARSIDQAFAEEGFKVFFDCKNGFQNALPAIDESRYFIILFTDNSLAAIEKYPYETIKEMVKKEKTAKEGEGYNFVRELYEIENRIKSKIINKKNVFLLDIDERYTNGINNALSESHYEELAGIARTTFPTNKNFSINDLINPKNESDNRIRKRIHCFKNEIPWFRFSYKRCKKYSLCFAILLPLSIVMVYMLYQYSREKVIFAGGGTVKQYLHDSLKIDVDDFQLGSEYIHLPSTTAWQLLWDDINEDQPRQYCPIILSTNKIDIKGANIEGFIKKDKRIAEYLIDSIPLKVQIIDQTRDTVDATISLDSLRKKLMDINKYEIWTTSKESGTYHGYKKLLNDSVSNFNLDTIVKQSGGMKVFTPDRCEGVSSKKIKILLANENYCYKYANKSYTILDTTRRTRLYLYAYTIASKNNDHIEILPRAQKFFSRIGCDATKEQVLIDTMVVYKWPKLQ